MLGIYSKLTSRVFPRRLAREGGTLILLLREIKQYFAPFEGITERFEREAGQDLTEAKKEGPGAVRRLLLSREWKSLQVVRNIPRVLHRTRHRR
jgi:hypothetical protein